MTDLGCFVLRAITKATELYGRQSLKRGFPGHLYAEAGHECDLGVQEYDLPDERVQLSFVMHCPLLSDEDLEPILERLQERANFVDTASYPTSTFFWWRWE